MRIALAQFAASTQPADNLARVQELAASAAARGAELVVFPEAAMCSFARARADAAEPIDGPWANAVRHSAADLGLTIVAGMFTTGATNRVRNTLLVTGAAETHYDKVHLFDALGYRESEQIEPGTDAVTFTLGEHTIGLATCYDIRFPALFTHLAGLGAEVILVPASWAPGPGKVHQWRTLATARAMDSTSFVVAVDQSLAPAGGEPGGSRQPTGVGHSVVVDPSGEILLELGDGDDLALVDLDLSLVAGTRRRLPVLRHAHRF